MPLWGCPLRSCYIWPWDASKRHNLNNLTLNDNGAQCEGLWATTKMRVVDTPPWWQRCGVSSTRWCYAIYLSPHCACSRSLRSRPTDQCGVIETQPLRGCVLFFLHWKGKLRRSDGLQAGVERSGTPASKYNPQSKPWKGGRMQKAMPRGTMPIILFFCQNRSE